MDLWKLWKLRVLEVLGLLATGLTFAFPANPVFADQTIDLKALRALLSTTHAISWQSVASTAEAKERIRQLLQEEIGRSLGPESSQSSEQQQYFERALTEYGHFSKDAQGGLHPDAVALYDSLKSKALAAPDDSSLIVAYLDSLKNANTPESLKETNDFLKANKPVSTYKALVDIETMLSPTPPPWINEKTDTEAENRYLPNLGIPMNQRLKLGDWKKQLEAVELNLKNLLKTNSLHPALAQRLPVTLQTVSHTLHGLTPKVPLTIPSESIQKIGSSPSEPATPNNLTTPSSQTVESPNSHWMGMKALSLRVLYVLGGSLLFLMLYRLYRRLRS